MRTKEKEKETPAVKDDSLKDTARDVLCAMIASNDSCENLKEAVETAYSYAQAFEDYKN